MNGESTADSITQSTELRTTESGVSFYTKVTLDPDGILALDSQVRNTNYFGKKKIKVRANVLNQGKTISLLETDTVTLYGIMAALFIPGRKSSTVISRYQTTSFDDVSPNYVDYYSHPSIRSLDNDISVIAGDIRRLRILIQSQREGQPQLEKELNDSVQTLSEKKSERMAKLHDLERRAKFESVNLSVQHICQ